MGFEKEPSKATSHTQWSAVVNGVKYRVTLDAHNAPYCKDLLASICKQAGVSKKEMFAAIKKKGHPRDKSAAQTESTA